MESSFRYFFDVVLCRTVLIKEADVIILRLKISDKFSAGDIKTFPGLIKATIFISSYVKSLHLYLKSKASISQPLRTIALFKVSRFYAE